MIKNVTDQQFEEVKALFHQVIENTKPSGKIRQTFEKIGLIATIGGLFAVIEQIIQWIVR